jgi:pyruvate/2-oxoglutarate dehydrogenase complex dihydrolipoamide dehydrogenase (E3) component
MNMSRPSANSDPDVIVLGVGTSGEDLSLRLLGAGLNVVGIEASLVGGECPYWACLPSKMMIRAANALQEARRISGLAGQAQVIPDWGPVAARIRAEATGGWDDSVAVARFESRGGRLIHGRGRLTGPRTVAVGDETITARIGVVIATGSRALIPSIPGLNEVDYWTTHEMIQAEQLPESIVVLGGGAIGSELSQVLARFSVKVTVLEANERILPGEEPEVSESVSTALAAEGIEIRTGAVVEEVGQRDDDIVLTLAAGQEVVAERLLVATGRTVDLSGLGFETVGLDGSAPFIKVDERMRAGDGLWAMGDATGKGMFTHVALYQSGIIAADILGEERPAARYDAVPRAVFTDPEVGSVGLTEAEARANGIDVVVAVKQIGSTFRGWLHVAGSGAIKLVAERDSGTLIGASVVAPHGAEVMGMLSLAVHSKLSMTDLQSMIYAFPTFYGAVGEAVGAYGRGLATVLDPTYKGVEALDSLTVTPVS